MPFEKGTSPKPPPRKLSQLGTYVIIHLHFKGKYVQYCYSDRGAPLYSGPFPEQRLNLCELYRFFIRLFRQTDAGRDILPARVY